MTTVYWYFVSLTKYSFDEIPVLCMILGKTKKILWKNEIRMALKTIFEYPSSPPPPKTKQFSHFAYINVYHEPWFFLMDLFCYRTQ